MLKEGTVRARAGLTSRHRQQASNKVVAQSGRQRRRHAGQLSAHSHKQWRYLNLMLPSCPPHTRVAPDFLQGTHLITAAAAANPGIRTCSAEVERVDGLLSSAPRVDLDETEAGPSAGGRRPR